MDKNTTAAEIGRRVESGRIAAGLSRRAFALDLKIPLTNYRDREMGRRDFDMPQLRAISAKLDMDLTELVSGLPSSIAA